MDLIKSIREKRPLGRQTQKSPNLWAFARFMTSDSQHLGFLVEGILWMRAYIYIYEYLYN